MILEVRPEPKDPLKVEFFASGRRVENIRVEKIYNNKGKLTVRAVIEYDPTAVEQKVRIIKQEVPDNEVQGKE